MSRRKKRGSSLAPLLIIGVIGVVGYVLLGRAPAPSNTAAPPKAAEKPAAAAIAEATGTRILIGASVPTEPSDRLYLLTLEDKSIVEKKTAAGWRVGNLDSAAQAVSVAPKSGSDASVLSGNGWNVSLRDKKGNAYLEPRLFGFFDARHAGVLARKDASLVLLSVSTAGEIREIYTVGETANPLSIGGGSAWFSTFQPGEGIESEPRGPSELIRVLPDGTASTVMTSFNVIVSALAGPDNALAALSSDGKLTIQTADHSQTMEGKPLLWLDNNRLLYSRGMTLFLWDAANEQTSSVGLMTEEPSAASFSPDRK